MQMEDKQEKIKDAGAEPIAVHQSTDGKNDEAGKPTGLEVAVMLPPPPAIVSLVAAVTAAAESRSTTLANNPDKDEDEVLSLQVLSGRSSTPYTVQGVCCANANCELGTADSSTAVSPVKEEDTQLMSDENTKRNDEPQKHCTNGRASQTKKYSRGDLMGIREEMTIVRPECLENARLSRLLIRKTDNNNWGNGSGNNRNKSFRSNNQPNDMMPAFFKRKAAIANGNSSNSSNSITYDNFKYSDSNPFSHHGDSGSSGNSYRRIGSGRITNNRDTNWDYIPEEDSETNNLPEFFNTKDNKPHPKPQRHSKKHELDDNSNIVKRVINSVVGDSSFRSGGSKNSHNSSTEERYHSNTSIGTHHTNKSEEPEWFSCGPTSRLDTVELCGFNESDQQKIRFEMAKNSKPDANNNREEFHSHKDKKHLAFQFDDFSTTHTSRGNNNNGALTENGVGIEGPKMPSSKFMPLFNAKKKEDEPPKSQNTSQSLNDFFKRKDMTTASGSKEKLNLTEIPSVNEIEAKWRTAQQHNESRNKTTSDSVQNSSENFKKMLHKLNQQQHGPGASVSSPPPVAPQQQPMNLFNNENLSTFIKQRSFQQQLLQKQQQQAAFAQLQLNAILSRPDTQLLLLSLVRGEISKHGLIIQLSNPNLSQSDREAISAVLTFSAAGQFHQQLAINSNHQQQQQLIANQLQNLALMQQMNKSPVAKRNTNAAGLPPGANNNGGNNQRTYTQEELQSHANYILHNAMLKKKLEEQNMGLQKMLHMHTSILNNGNNSTNNNNTSRGGYDSTLAGPKNQQHQQRHSNYHHQTQNHNQRHGRGSNSGNRSNMLRRRRSTSSSSSNATVNSNNMSNMQFANDLELRRQLEQRRNTIATATLGGDEFHQVSQRI